MFPFSDYILNGEGHGAVAEQLAGCQFQPSLLRPYLYKNVPHCTYNGKNRPIQELVANGISSPVFNATSLRKDEWIELDNVVVKAARSRLRAWDDLAASNSFGGFDGMAKMVLEHETMSDPGEAHVDMDGLTAGNTDSPKYQLEGLPLPITHSDFFFSQRRLAVSRNTGTPLNTTMAEAAGRRVAEEIEKTTIGMITGATYGNASEYSRNPTVYGYTNFPGRTTKTDVTVPTGLNPDATVDDILEMRDLAYDANFFGPFMLYHSKDWDRYLDDDYGIIAGSDYGFAPNRTLRDRIRSIEGIQDVRRLDFFTSSFNLLLVQMTSEVARAVIGMPLTTIQWESRGGMMLNFKVMTIMVPQLREDFNGNCGIIHGTTA